MTFFKEKMKEEPCFYCGKMTEVENDYEPMGCCDGHECSCIGMIINPVFCEKCFQKRWTGEG